MDVLARGDGLEADLDMRFGHGQVEDYLDRGIGRAEHRRLRGDAEFGGRASAAARAHVGERDDVEDRKGLRGLEIGRANVAAADHPDTDPFHASSLNSIEREAVRGRSCPRRAIEFAQSHGGRATRPDAVVPFARDEVGDVGEARREERGDCLTQRPDECSLLAIARPVMMTLGGANRVMRLAIGEAQRLACGCERGGHALSPSSARRGRRAIPRPEGSAASTSASTEIRRPYRRDALRRFPAAHEQVAEIGRDRSRRERVRQCRMPRPRLRSTDDQEIVEFARLTEPMFGERDQIGVAVDRHGDAEPARQQAPNATSLSPKIGLCRQTPPRSHHSGQADANAERYPHLEVGVARAAPHAVLDEVGNDGRRLPVDADRERQLLMTSAQKSVTAIVIGRARAHADDARGKRVEPQHHARPASAGVVQRAELQDCDQLVVQQRGRDRRDRRRDSVR